MSVSNRDPSSDRDPLLNLTTHQLQYLVSVSRGEMLSEAAEALSVSQSALSQGLTELERKIGLDLFERRGRNRVLTAHGQTVASHAERILASTRDLTNWAGAVVKGDRGMVRLGLIDIAAVNHFPNTLMDFRHDRPGIELRLTVAPSAALTRRLSDGELDAAVIVEPPLSGFGAIATAGADSGSLAAETGRIEHGEFNLIHLFAEELAIYAPAGLGFAIGPDAEGQVDVGQPSDWGPWVTFPQESHTRRHIARALRQEGAEFRVEAESHQPEVLRQMVHLGMGWTVLPVLQAEAQPNPLVRARRLPLLTRRLVIAQRRSSTSDPATHELIDRLRRRAEDLAGGDAQTSPS